MFVSFEGADGSGKSTQAELLRETLAAEGRDVVLTREPRGATPPRAALPRETLAAGGRDVVLPREPGGTELGERARELVLNGPPMGAWAEEALYAASRAAHEREGVRPARVRAA